MGVLSRACSIVSWPLAAWASVNAALFWWAYFRYHHEPQYQHVRHILGRGLCVSRGTAAVLHVSFCLVLLPVSRTLHLMIARAALPRRLPLICTSLLRRARAMHIACATTILIASVIHTISHVINAINFSELYNPKYPAINWASYQGQNPLELIFTTMVGLTGVAMLTILAVMAISSLPCVRRLHYNVFWLSHHLALPLLLLYIAHPSSGLIKELANPDEYLPDCEVTNNFTLTCPQPKFQAPTSIAWFWVTIPLLFLMLDLGTRVIRMQHPVNISCAGALPGAAVELWLSSPRFTCEPGQYVLLHCPTISSLEWHPYTIIKCPTSSDSRITVIVRGRGDWSRDLCQKVLLAAKSSNYISIEKTPLNLNSIRLYINGPFASPLQRVLACKRAVCVGAGVGITPFASVLRYMLEQEKGENPERFHLVWLSPDPHQLLWFAWTISSLHNKCWNQNKPDKFIFDIYITRNYDKKYIENFIVKRYPLVACRIQEGRPKWSVFFQQLSNLYGDKKKVHMFGCGSSKLMKTLSWQCHQANQLTNTKFQFIREAYS